MAPKLALDHIVVSAERLEDGVDYVQDTLEVKMAPGGKHPDMSTHNQLLGLGAAYLEVIAIDPDAPDIARPRWFDLDNFSGAPRLTNWVAKTPDISGALAVSPDGIGVPMKLSRADLTWTVAVSEDGTLPMGGAFPGIIDWGDTPHPTTRLPDVGCSLSTWTIQHPMAKDLRDQLGRFETDLTDGVAEGEFGFRAEIMTPHGLRVLT